jgi:hypothetical protein
MTYHRYVLGTYVNDNGTWRSVNDGKECHIEMKQHEEFR